jgi:endonuclease/exonuclease/phosphatase family metal-dependent hydrolase
VLDVGESEEAKVSSTTKLLSLNLHCLRTDGTAFTNNTERFAAIAALVAKENVNAIAVQEACVRGSESAMKMLSAALESATKTAWSSTWTFAHRAWEGTPDEADEGVGLLLRGTMSGEEAITHRVQTSLTRVAVSAVVDGVRLYSVHFDHANVDARTMQARELAVRALVDTDPVFGAVIAGDFNARAGADAHAAFTAFGFVDLSSSGGIDHVVAHRASGITGVGRLVLDGKDGPRVSDHPGVLVALQRGARTVVTTTRITARASLKSDQWLSLRGAEPLSWTRGWPMRSTPEGFRVVLTELAGKTEGKVLIDDVSWMTGANVPIAAGTDTMIEPTF